MSHRLVLQARELDYAVGCIVAAINLVLGTGVPVDQDRVTEILSIPAADLLPSAHGDLAEALILADQPARALEICTGALQRPGLESQELVLRWLVYLAGDRSPASAAAVIAAYQLGYSPFQCVSLPIFWLQGAKSDRWRGPTFHGADMRGMRAHAPSVRHRSHR